MSNYLEKYKVNVPVGGKGDVKIDQFTIGKDTPGAIHYALHSRPIDEGTYTRLLINNHCVMSDTPAEIQDHLYFIGAATGRVLINGLGLGVVLKAVAAKPDVTHIDVVELNQNVIDLVWPIYKDGDRIVLHHADAYNIEWPKGMRWDCVWHDIWPDMCTDNLEGITKLKRKYARRCDYQAAWVEEELRYRNRRDRASAW